MLFNSYVFVLTFLPLLLVSYYVLGRYHHYRLQQLVLIGASLYFYGYFNPSYLLIICASIVFNFVFSNLLLNSHREAKNGAGKALLILGLTANLGLLFYFKYFDFFLENINLAFKTDFQLRHILLPLGISFFTFQQISYLVDSYKGKTEGHGFLNYALFVSFFPQLVAGPIVLYREVIPQFQKEENLHINFDNLAHGLYCFALGLFKKVLIADLLGKAVTYGFAEDTYMTLSSLEIIIVTFSYTFQIYFDFSGYCDMAVGIGLMFNIKLPANFDSPYKSLDIIDFWSRWHMTLTRFLTEYVYIPLGGNRKGKLRTYANIMAVFLLSGLWHGANWTFVLWGALHGLANVLTRAFRDGWRRMHTASQWLINFLLVNCLWLLFRAESVSQAKHMLGKMLLMDSLTVREEFSELFCSRESELLALIGPLRPILQNIQGIEMWGLLALCLFICLNFKNCGEAEFEPRASALVKTVLLLVWATVSLAGVSTFLYFNF